MRVSQIRRTEQAACKAIDFAKYDAYMETTAITLAGHICLPGNPGRARIYFERLLGEGSESSWLYQAESWLGLAASVLRTGGKAAQAYSKLVVAQYIYSLLGLQGTPHPNLHETLTQADLTPSDIALHDPVFDVLTPQHRTELRHTAIIDFGLQYELFADLALIDFSRPHEDVRFAGVAAFKRRTSVLVLGQDTSKIEVLQDIRAYLNIRGYRGVLVKNELDIPEDDLEQKVIRLAQSCNFVVVEHTTPSGHIDELKLLAPIGFTIAVLHQEGIQATWMQTNYYRKFGGVKFFPYQRSALRATLDQACLWAERRLAENVELQNKMYPWRNKTAMRTFWPEG